VKASVSGSFDELVAIVAGQRGLEFRPSPRSRAIPCSSAPSPGTPGEGWGEGDFGSPEQSVLEITLILTFSASSLSLRAEGWRTGRRNQMIHREHPIAVRREAVRHVKFSNSPWRGYREIVLPRSRLRRGFIFIFFGSRGIVSNDSAAPVKQRCPRCGRETEMVAKRYRNWFTLFFIPVFPISAPRKFIQCVNCGAQFPLAADAARAVAQASDAQQTQQAIGLYNSLRSSPANSITLNQLMMLYASLKEYDQAISAAADFPQALNASEQCMTTLARVYLAQNKFAEALQWFGAAIERNPHLGEAHYYKGVAHMLTEPPDLTQAVASARAARNAGYPGADELLQQAQEKARAAEG